jgi:CheY-like chemotaxis protein
MLFDTLHMLLTLLLPWVLGALVLGGIVVWLVGRQPGARRATPPSPPAAPEPPTPSARTAPTSPSARAPTPPPQPAPRPAAPSAAPATPAAAVPVAGQAQPLQADLLLVDDSAVVRAKLRRLFEPAGYRIALARDGEEALALLQAGRYALLLTDLEMPRLDGVGLIRAVQQQPGWAGMPILAITGHDDLQAQLNQLQAVTGIYRKPWTDDDLLGHVQALVQPSLVPAPQAED